MMDHQPPDSKEEQVAHWERDTLRKLAFATLLEQRRRRRWSIFFKMLFFGYALAILYLIWPDNGLVDSASTKTHAALIDIKGTIAAGSESSADLVVTGLRKAFKDKKTLGIILRINSPGGSPVQADYIFQEIQRLRAKHKKVKVYAVCTDVCASAAYYIASAADEIYANPSSIVGSIGVLMNGFGFVDTLKKVGAERRLITSGKNKGFLDPFSPLKPQDVTIAKSMMDDVHDLFIQRVKSGRGDRLKPSKDLYTGRPWSGTQAVKLGLLDGFKSPGEVARDILKTKRMVDYTQRPDPWERLSKQLGAEFNGLMLRKMLMGIPLGAPKI